jgi:hypothetical protein
VNTKYRYLRLTDAEIVAFSKKSIPYWDFYIFLFCQVWYYCHRCWNFWISWVHLLIIAYVVSLLCSVWR